MPPSSQSPPLGLALTALRDLGLLLRGAGYRFVTVTPETHRRVNQRDKASGYGRARSLRDVFGWSRPFRREDFADTVFDLLVKGEAVTEEDDGLFRATVRFSSLRDGLFLHSAFPTVEADAVFFGPDTYRFCAWLDRQAPRSGRVVDVGCGAGAGGLSLASPDVSVVLADVNERALDFARVNAALVGAEVELCKSDVLADVEGAVDRVVANPPYMVDRAARTYRDGGGDFGEALAVRIVRESLARLSRGGLLHLYTGAAIVDGEDTFFREAEPLCRAAGATVQYEEIDPDVFGEELDESAYASVERIAAVGLTVTLP